MKVANLPKNALVREFTAVGLNAAEVFKVLPAWWDEAIAHPTGVFEVKGFVAKHFGLDIGPDACLRPRTVKSACFKTSSGADFSEIESARAMACAVAKMVAYVTIPTWSGNFPSAVEVRDGSLSNPDGPWGGLNDLLSACWSNGVPVIYMPHLPVAKSMMDGMVTLCNERPVIVITEEMPTQAWMRFVLAHEMGHIACHHLNSNDDTIVDEKVIEDYDGRDQQEEEANTYANKVLYSGENKWSPEDTSTVTLCREALEQNVRVDDLSHDSFEFLENMGIL